MTAPERMEIRRIGLEEFAERGESGWTAPLLNEIDSPFHAVKALLEWEGRSAHA